MSIHPTSGEFFSSIVSDIKNYDGKDPLRPWLQGIKKMQRCFPSHVLREKLPRFLQKCVQTFQFDRRYHNDARYVAVWIQLMDFVDDPKALLRMMETSRIGLKQAAYYMAYALFYEKQKKFEKAEKMYYFGVGNLAEPASDLQKAYEKFLHRKELYMRRKSKLQETQAKVLSNAVHPNVSKDVARKISQGLSGAEEHLLPGTKGINSQEHQKSYSKVSGNCSYTGHDKSINSVGLPKEKSIIKSDHTPTCIESETEVDSLEQVANLCASYLSGKPRAANFSKDKGQNHVNANRQSSICSDETVLVKFVGSAIVGKSEVEDACHHGLVDPTVNMKEAINEISNMFREPLELDSKVKRQSSQRQSKGNQVTNSFEVFVDEDSNEQENFHCQKKDGCPGANKNASIIGRLNNPSLPKKQMENETSFVGAFTILVDDEEDGNNDDDDDERGNHDKLLMNQSMEDSELPLVHPHACPKIKEPLSACFEGPDTFSTEDVSPKDDTIIQRFVGSGIFGEPKVENACHHGLVDPTINTKEAMHDINDMFGKPINFVRPGRTKRQADLLCQEQACHGFSILADNVVIEEHSKIQSSMDFSRKPHAGSDLFEPTIFTKEALDEMNSMFGVPLDF